MAYDRFPERVLIEKFMNFCKEVYKAYDCLKDVDIKQAFWNEFNRLTWKEIIVDNMFSGMTPWKIFCEFGLDLFVIAWTGHVITFYIEMIQLCFGLKFV